jgi:hypothetical protein
MRIKIVIPKFHAAFNEAPVRMFLRDVGDKVKQIMVQQAAAPKTGRVYLEALIKHLLPASFPQTSLAIFLVHTALKLKREK